MSEEHEHRPDTAPPDPPPVVLGRSEHGISRRNIDPDALRILYRLQKQGFTAYLCGGAVRDLMMDRSPKDFDIATDARPGQIRKRFPRVFIIGRRFRLAHVHFPGGKIIEVATFRKDPQATCEIAPGPAEGDEIHYGTPRQDAFRRDITINALFYDPSNFTVLDYVGGVEDLARRRVRVIGDPAVRFAEDPVRLWRVLRYAARLEFEVDERTERLIRPMAGILAGCSGSRLYEELNKDLASPSLPVLEPLRSHGLLKHVLGAIGEEYERDEDLFVRLKAVLSAKDKAQADGHAFDKDEAYAALLWPWAERRLADLEGDGSVMLAQALVEAKVQATLPRLLRADFVQILTIGAALLGSLETGRMRWSLRKKSHFAQAARIVFLIAKGRLPHQGETFEGLLRQTHPEVTEIGPRRRRRRRRKPGPGRRPEGGRGGPAEAA